MNNFKEAKTRRRAYYQSLMRSSFLHSIQGIYMNSLSWDSISASDLFCVCSIAVWDRTVCIKEVIVSKWSCHFYITNSLFVCDNSLSIFVCDNSLSIQYFHWDCGWFLPYQPCLFLQLVPKSLLASQQGCIKLLPSHVTTMPLHTHNKEIKYSSSDFIIFQKQWPSDPVFTR